MDVYQLFTSIEELNSPDPRTRYRAIGRLGKIRDPRGGSPLLARLDDSDRWCRLLAIKSLGEIGHQPARQPLLALLQSDDPLLLSTVIIALQSIGDEETLHRVARFLYHTDLRVCADAVETVGELSGHLGSRQHLEELRPLLSRQNNRLVANTVVALCRNQVTTIDEMVGFIREHLLRSSDPWMRASGVFALGRIAGGESELIAALNDPAIDVVMNVIRSLGNLRTPGSVHALVGLLARHEIRHKVVVALGQLGDRKAVEPLRRVLPGSNVAVQRRIIEAFGQIGDPSVIETLVQQLSRPELRSAAIAALGRLRQPAATTALLELLDQPLPSATELEIIAALGETGSPPVVEHLRRRLRPDRPPRILAAASWALSRFGNEAVPVLLSLLGEPTIAPYAIKALTEMRTTALPALLDLFVTQGNPAAGNALIEIGLPALPALIAAFHDIDKRDATACDLPREPGAQGTTAGSLERLRICRCVYRILSPDTLEFFVTQLRSPDEAVRRFAAFVIPTFTPLPQVVGDLLTAMDDADPVVRMACARMLLEFRDRPEVAQRLRAALDDPHWGVVCCALEGIDEIEDPELLAQFTRLMASPEQLVARTAAQVYVRACGVTIRDLIESGNRDPRFLDQLFAMVRHVASSDDLIQIARLLGHPDPALAGFAKRVMRDAAASAVPVMLTTLADAPPAARIAIIEVLGALGAAEAAPRLADVVRCDLDRTVRDAAIAALATFGMRGAPVLLDLFARCEAKDDPDLQLALMAALDRVNQAPQRSA